VKNCAWPLLAVLAAVPDQENRNSHVRPLAIIWGTSVGLALAHWVAFRLSVRIVNRGLINRDKARLAASQFAGAVGAGTRRRFRAVWWRRAATGDRRALR
jgi:hypothetical protein